jgi:uncharacterized protein (TIGR02598 family)
MKTLKEKHAGFSLVEVALALGISAFCLLTLVGLLSVGFSSMGSSRRTAEASTAMVQIANAIRGASANSSGQYQGLGAFSNISWNKSSSVTNIELTSGGLPSAGSSEKSHVARVQILPATNSLCARTAFVSVAWPNAAQWDEQRSTWTHAEGSISTWVVFMPSL